MKCKNGKKFLAVLAAFFLGTVNNVVKAADESEIKNIIGIGVGFDFLNFQTGMENNLKTFAGIDKNDDKKKYTGQGWNFGVEGILNYDLYFNDLIAFSAIVKGGYNKIGTYKYDDGITSSGSGSGSGSGSNDSKDDDKKLVSVSGGNVDLMIGPKFNFLSEGLSFTDGEQEGLRFAVGLYGGIGFNFGNPTIGDDAHMKDNSKDKIEGSLIAVPVALDIECVFGFGLKANIGCGARFISPIKEKKEKDDNNTGNTNQTKDETSFSMGIRPYVGVGYDLGAIING